MVEEFYHEIEWASEETDYAFCIIKIVVGIADSKKIFAQFYDVNKEGNIRLLNEKVV